MAKQSDSSQELIAEYLSETGEKLFKHNVGDITSEARTDDRVRYLASLRASVVKMQDEINTFLTRKMDEDKQAAAAQGQAVDDKREEENYGEEVVED